MFLFLIRNIPAPGATNTPGENYRNAYPPQAQAALPQRPYNQQQPPSAAASTPPSTVGTTGPIAGAAPTQYPPAPTQQFDYRQQEQVREIK